MKQVLQNLKNGKTELIEVPIPTVSSKQLLIQSKNSLISAGTERMLVEFGKTSLIGKAKAQPDKVKQVLDKIKTEGLLPTLEAVFTRLDEPLPLGYCNAGKIISDCGFGIADLKKGDRVVSNGSHAEIVTVTPNLCAKIPDEVSDEQAAFAVLASIGLQGIRLAQPALGEYFVVYGLGLIGLIAVQLLKVNGCEVLGVDLNPGRLKIAEKYGAVTVNAGTANPIAATMSWTNGKGVDGVLVAASAKTDDIVHQAAQMCRKRGRIILVGVVGLNLRRADFFEKELSFQVSCSYGPGRYDESYEQDGHDYPYGFVRWTEQRNFEAILEMMRTKRLVVDDLITHRFKLEDAPKAYEAVISDSNALGVILEYSEEPDRSPSIRIQNPVQTEATGSVSLGVIGAGNFSKMTLLPALAKTGTRIVHVADLKGEAANHLAKKFGAENATTDYQHILRDTEVNAVLIAVGHNLHARLVCESLKAGKHVFVEKPLAMNPEELKEILGTMDEVIRNPQSVVHIPMLMVGFNRRFSPHILKIKGLLEGRSEPLAMNMVVNAGIIPPDHWVHDPVRGGGRIIGEACHFIDLMVHLSGSRVKTVAATRMGKGSAILEDKMSISLGFEDGSVGTVNYFGNGSKAYPKETLEVFSEGRILHLDNFRRTVGFGFRGFRRFSTRRQDKGHRAEMAAFIERIAEGGETLIPLAELVNVTLASFAAVTAARESRTIDISKEYGSLSFE